MHNVQKIHWFELLSLAWEPSIDFYFRIFSSEYIEVVVMALSDLCYNIQQDLYVLNFKKLKWPLIQ